MTFTIKHARRVAKDHDLQACVVLTVARDGIVTVTTYGEDKKKCDAIGAWGQGLWKYAVTVVPFRTIFGWGNAGKPKGLSKEEWVTMGEHSPEAQAFARLWDTSKKPTPV